MGYVARTNRKMSFVDVRVLQPKDGNNLQTHSFPTPMREFSEFAYDVNIKHITDIFRNKQFAGKPIYIVGGGDSLRGFDYKKLDGKISIGINKGYLWYDFTIHYAMDTAFYDMIKQRKLKEKLKFDPYLRWKGLKSTKIFLTPMSYYQFDPDVYLVRRFDRVDPTFDLKEGIWGATNSGCGALSLAIALGGNPIYLLGCDVKVNNGNTHCHSGYERIESREVIINEYIRKCAGFKTEFERFAPHAMKHNIKILNVNREEMTELRCFPIISQQEAGL